MPRSGGIYTLPPGYFAVDGTTIEVSQHNPPLEDIAQALTDSLPRDGSAPMTGNLAMGSNKITNLAAATNPADAVRFDQLPTVTPTTATLTAGTNAQGQGPITTDQVTITTAAANPSGATLPTAVAGDRVIIANRGANPVNIYPATGAAIGALATNAPVLLAVNQSVEFFARSATQWEGQISQPLDADLTALAALGSTGIAVRTAADTWAQRQIVSADGSVTITNPAGVAGDINLSAQADLIHVLASAHAGANANTAQDLFPLDITLDANSVYQYELVFAQRKTVGATTHRMRYLFDGTVGVTTIHRNFYMSWDVGSSTAASSLSWAGYYGTTAEREFTNDMTNAGISTWMQERGVIITSTAGTFIPQYRLTAAPGGAYSTQAGSYFRLRKVGAAGGDIAVGPWA